MIAFGKLQEIIPGKSIGLGRAQILLNTLLLILAIVLSVVIGVGGTSEWLIVGILLIARSSV